MKPTEKREVKTIIKVENTDDISYQDIILDDNLTRKEGIEVARKAFKQPDLDKSKISVLHKKSQPKDILAFDEENNVHIDRNQIDWKQMINRNIYMKLDTIFEALKWNLKDFLKNKEE